MVQLAGIGSYFPAEPGDGDAHEEEEPEEQYAQPHQHDDQSKRGRNPVTPQPGVDRAEEEGKDHREEDGIEDRRGKPHPDEDDHQRGEQQHHPQEGGLAQRGGYGFTDSGFAIYRIARGFVHDLAFRFAPGSVAKLGAQSYQLVLRGYLLLTQMSPALVGSLQSLSYLLSTNRLPRLAHSDVVGGDEDATAGSLASFGVRR